MTEQTTAPTPAEASQSCRDASAAWASYNDIELDVRLAQRSGDADAVAAAQATQDVARSAWHKLHVKAKQDMLAALVEAGFDTEAVKRYIDS